MTQYIDKNALIAEVEERKADLIACKKDATTPEARTAISGMIRLCKDFMNDINALEVKEVDMEKEIDSQWKDCAPVDEGTVIDQIEKHFPGPSEYRQKEKQ